MSIFFRSSFQISGRGMNCTYQVTKEKIDNDSNQIAYNGEGK